MPIILQSVCIVAGRGILGTVVPKRRIGIEWRWKGRLLKIKSEEERREPKYLFHNLIPQWTTGKHILRFHISSTQEKRYIEELIFQCPFGPGL